MNKTRKRALLSAISMLIVSAVVLSTATFAWFSAGAEATVQNISVSVTQTSGIKISEKNTNFRGNVTIQDLYNVANGNAIYNPGAAETIVFSPQSTTTASFSGSQLNMYAGSLDADELLTATLNQVTATNNGYGYVAFDLWIQATGAAVVTFGGTSVGGDASQVARAAWCLFGQATTVGAVPGAISSVKIIEPQATATPYEGLKAPVPGVITTAGILPANATYTSTVTALTDFSTCTINFANAGYARVRIYLWADGQDAQCTDTTFSGSALTLDVKVGLVP